MSKLFKVKSKAWDRLKGIARKCFSLGTIVHGSWSVDRAVCCKLFRSFFVKLRPHHFWILFGIIFTILMFINHVVFSRFLEIVYGDSPIRPKRRIGKKETEILIQEIPIKATRSGAKYG